MFCRDCGKEISDNAAICIHCGVATTATTATTVSDLNLSDGSSVSPLSKTTLLLLCVFVGSFGVHRFYAGKIGTGVLMLLTLGCCGVLTFIDFVMILTGAFTDSDGCKVVRS